MSIVYIFVSVAVVSLISLVGALYLFLSKNLLEKILLYLVAFSVGALFGDVFIHIIPAVTEKAGFTFSVGAFFLGGLLLFFVMEKFIHWHHCHRAEHSHVRPFAYINLLGDGLHNLLDGMIIAGSFLASVPIGIATTIAVVLHEIPQEMGDFGVLLHAGLSKRKALFFNLLSACASFVGAILVVVFYQYLHNVELYLLALAGGGFIYIAGSDLIPELHTEECGFDWRLAMYQFFAILLGIGVMVMLLYFE